MRRMKSEDLLAIVDFLYYGETNIYQENLDTFLNIAEELKLKGLNGGEDVGGEVTGNGVCHTQQTFKPTVPRNGTHKTNVTTGTRDAPSYISLDSELISEDQVLPSMAVALPKQEFAGNINELDEKIATMIYRGEN